MKSKLGMEYEKFSEAMTKILKAKPEVVKAAMEAEKQEREAEAKTAGKRGRGRPPKASSVSPASSSRDV